MFAGSHPPTRSSVVEKSKTYLLGYSFCSCYSGVACQNLGYQNGYHLCCGAFGNTFYPIMDSVSCGSSDRDLTTCSHQVPGSFACTKNNVAVACYNGTAPTGKSPVVTVACYKSTTPIGTSAVVTVACYKGTVPTGRSPVMAVACYSGTTRTGKSPVVAVAC